VSCSILTALAATLAVTAAACGDAVLYPYEPMPDPIMPVMCPDSMIGYAWIAGDTAPATGGSMTTVDVSDLGGLMDALAETQPLVIRLDGMLTTTDKIQIKTNDKTIIGVGTNSGLIGGGIELSGVDNIWLRNLRIEKVQIAGNSDGDAIRLTTATHVWIDHCDLSSERDVPEGVYDGLVDMSHASDYVTVSWTLFHDHRDTSLVGHSQSADAQLEDAGHLHVTYHHNQFRNVESGPRVRFGTIHVFNNHFQDVGIFGVAAETMATARVDHNVFERVSQPITTDYLDTLEGKAQDLTNTFKACGGSNITMTTDLVLPYSVTPDSTDGALALVGACAGTRENLPSAQP
jgi:pectate lyase